MTDSIPKFMDLAIEDRLLVLTWMRDALHNGMKKTITGKTYAGFVTALNGGAKFDPEAIWETIPEPSRDHFEHAADILAQLDSDIEFCEDTIEAGEDTVENDPFDDQPDEPDQVDGPDLPGQQVDEETA